MLCQKGGTFYPINGLAILEKKGAVWDLEGNKYIDMAHMSVGTCSLGYANLEVDREFLKQ